MRLLLDNIQEGFRDDCRAANDDIAAFWTNRDSLNVTDGVILYRDRVVCHTPVSPWQGPSIPSFRTPRSWEPNLSYSGRVWPTTTGLSENTALPVIGQHRHKQPRPRFRRQSLQPRSNQYSQTFFFTLVDVTILWLEIDFPDGSRSSKLLMEQHKPVLRG